MYVHTLREKTRAFEMNSSEDNRLGEIQALTSDQKIRRRTAAEIARNLAQKLSACADAWDNLESPDISQVLDKEDIQTLIGCAQTIKIVDIRINNLR